MICSFSFILTDLLSTYQRPSFSRFFCLFSLWWLLTIHLAKTEHKRVGWHTQQNPSSHSSGGWKSGDSLVGFWGELSSWLVESQPASRHVLKWPFLCAWRDSERGEEVALWCLFSWIHHSSESEGSPLRPHFTLITSWETPPLNSATQGGFGDTNIQANIIANHFTQKN